ncbi:hypothetical protein M011DRAFT_398331 [Sporormia fimetaria CBS 119925]|uniref:Uncharacterized protein n=1 Tax=Sporormia fimetaria CBS 119925 TaxID=1340428 RepID=A0A6A6VH17_9PLEO|nr:hypothetical protein M011DRAFT_398331 [Sporormia fimetaria CBS 119925]
MNPESLPPYRPISSTPISTTQASEILTTYISNSEAHAHLHPDALITPSGVVFSSHGGPTGGVIMHNLRRVAAGLRGEYLEPEASPEPEERRFGGSNKTVFNEEGVNTEAEQSAQEGWQDKAEFEREEGVVEVGEIGDRSNFVGSGGDAPAVRATGQKRSLLDDKEARKKAKKERNKEFKKQKEMKKAKVDEE